MRLIELIQAGLCATCLTGCAYRGAVYSEYQQFDLDLRATTTSSSSAPVDVNLGYDRGVFAYVPKQNAETNSTQGEAVSLISWNNTASSINPSGTSSNSLLKVDAGFITGVAADVVTAPTNAIVYLVAPGLTNTIQTVGGPGDRITAATAVFAVEAAHSANEQAEELAVFTNDGNGKVAPSKLNTLVKGTFLDGKVDNYYNVPVEMLMDKLVGSWSPFVAGMMKNKP